jgi:hypothetical protein
MTAYETLMVIVNIIGLMISTSSLLISLLSFLDKRNNRK